ncbi:hypothetical protein [Fodinibius salinus]|uniref:hypothetical protein n=1 Tax=Fodinibius salinus TaxID=860790 RepID=UPI0011E6B29C|nr:hypothetical protein [Fodinibius salinus]
MAYFNFRGLLLCFFLIIVGTSISKAQHQLGVRWDPPQKTEVALQELEQFNDIGISILEVSPPLPSAVWTKIDSLQLTVYGQLNVRYPLTYTFSSTDSVSIQQFQQKISALISQPSVKSIGLFSYGAIHRQSFQAAIAPFINQIKNVADVDIYGILSPDQALPSHELPVDFMIRELVVSSKNLDKLSVSPHPLIKGYHYIPSASLQDYLLPFKKVIEATPKSTEMPTILVKDDWLLSMLKSFPQSKSTFQSLTQKKDIVFPLPNRSIPAPKSSSSVVILLLIIWLSVGLHYRASPIYRKSLFRYFTGHQFFVNDVAKRHFRTPTPAIILLFQNACALIIGTYISVKTLTNPSGLSAFFHHLPGAATLGTSALGLGFWISIISLAIAVISILWLSLTGKQLSSPSQLATLYSWPLHINLLLITLAVVFFTSGSGTFIIISCTVCAILLQISCFIITALDVVTFNRSRRLLYLSSTIVIYVGLILTGLIWVISNNYLKDVLSLTVSL